MKGRERTGLILVNGLERRISRSSDEDRHVEIGGLW